MLRVLFICAVTLLAIGCNSPDQITQVTRSNPIVGTWEREQHFGKDTLNMVQIEFKSDQNFISNQKVYIKNNIVGNLTYNGTYAILGETLYLHSANESLDYTVNYKINNDALRLIGVTDSDTSYWTKK